MLGQQGNTWNIINNPISIAAHSGEFVSWVTKLSQHKKALEGKCALFKELLYLNLQDPHLATDSLFFSLSYFWAPNKFLLPVSPVCVCLVLKS